MPSIEMPEFATVPTRTNLGGLPHLFTGQTRPPGFHFQKKIAMPKKIPLVSGNFYHLFNRGNNRDDIFYNEENYLYFLRLYKKHLTPIVKTFAYALLPNHYHFIVQIRELEDLPDAYRNGANLSRPFSNWQNAYAKAINKQQGRVSSLFEDRFERVQIKNDDRFTRLICYVHFNPEKHAYCNDFKNYRFTSYPAMLSNQPTSLEREEVLQWFGGKKAFVDIHLDYRKEWVEHKKILLDDYD